MEELLIKKFTTGIRWNFVESILYQALYLGHYILLFTVLDLNEYGIVGTLFSITYLVVSIGNFGLEKTLAVFYVPLTQSKSVFNQCLTSHFLFQITFFFFCALFFLFLSLQGLLTYNGFQIQGLLAIIIGVIFINEGIRKTVRTLLQYAFLNSKTARVEIISLSAYVGGIWGYYGIYHTLSIEHLIYWFACTSITSTFYLVYYAYQWHTTLTDTHSMTVALDRLKEDMRHSRVLNSINNALGYAVSTHALVTVFAFRWGIKEAAIASFIGTISHAINSLIGKTFNKMGNVLLSQSKPMGKRQLQNTFSFLTHSINQLVYCTAIFLIINFHCIQSYIDTKQNNPIPFTQTLLLLTLPLLLPAYTAYEKFYITQGHIHTILLYNIFLCINFYGAIYLLNSPLLFLFFLVILRLFAYFCISLRATKEWNITTNWKINPPLVLGSTLISWGIFFFLRTIH